MHLLKEFTSQLPSQGKGMVWGNDKRQSLGSNPNSCSQSNHEFGYIHIILLGFLGFRIVTRVE